MHANRAMASGGGTLDVWAQVPLGGAVGAMVGLLTAQFVRVARRRGALALADGDRTSATWAQRSWANAAYGVAFVAVMLGIMAATSSPAAVAAVGCGVAVANYTLDRDRQRLAGAPGGRKRALLASVGVALVVLVFVGFVWLWETWLYEVLLGWLELD